MTGLCAATTLSIVHPSLDVLIRSILILTNSLINPLLIKEKQSIQGGIEVYEGKVNLPQETDAAGIIYCLWIDANHVSLVQTSPNKGILWSFKSSRYDHVFH